MGASEYHGAGGPLRVSEQRSPRPLDRRLIAATEATGIRRIPDYNGPEQDGVSMFQVTQKNGQRFSAADAYLRPALRGRTWRCARARRCWGWRSRTSRAGGCGCAGPRLEELLRAEREVLLSAGAIGSPQLLLLSGVGAARGAAGRRRAGAPRASRRRAQPPGPPLRDDDVGGLRPEHPLRRRQARPLAEWLLRRTGKLSSTVAEVVAFTRTRGGLPAADIQFHMGAAYFEDHGAETYDGHCMVIAPVLVSPKARGQVWLRSSDPRAKPRIITNTLSEPEDLESMVAGMRWPRDRRPGAAARRWSSRS